MKLTQSVFVNENNKHEKNQQKEHWFLIDAKDQILGRFSTHVSNLLQQKDYHPNQENYVIVINSKLIKFLNRKKEYYRTSNRPGSLKIESFENLQEKFPNRILEKSISGMLPKNRMRKEYCRRLFIYDSDITIDNRYKCFLEKIKFRNF
jgi:large subunit ribosomal protein L13